MVVGNERFNATVLVGRSPECSSRSDGKKLAIAEREVSAVEESPCERFLRLRG